MAYVMIVDDDRMILDAMSEILMDEGFAVETAVHGREALDKLVRVGPPCLMFVDLMMPVMNGVELVKQLRAAPQYAAIPVVTFSAGRCLAPPEGTRFLSKPVRYDDVMQEVEVFCRRSE
jgi:CheY-like chemotaxis protein